MRLCIEQHSNNILSRLMLPTPKVIANIGPNMRIRHRHLPRAERTYTTTPPKSWDGTWYQYSWTSTYEGNCGEVQQRSRGSNNGWSASVRFRIR